MGTNLDVCLKRKIVVCSDFFRGYVRVKCKHAVLAKHLNTPLSSLVVDSETEDNVVVLYLPIEHLKIHSKL